MTAEDARRQRLTRLMEDRRVDLRMQWEDVADEIGISVAHLRRIRNGKASLTYKVTRGIDRSMQWKNGSTLRIMEDGDPEPLPAPSDPVAQSDDNPRSTLSVVEDIPLGRPDDPDPRDPEVGLGGLKDTDEVAIWVITGYEWWERAAAIRTIRKLKENPPPPGAQTHPRPQSPPIRHVPPEHRANGG